MKQLSKPTASKANRFNNNNLDENLTCVHQTRGHITDQSVYIDTLKCTKPTRLYPRNLPEVECFQEYASDLGLSNSHHLILYDRSPFGFYASSRMWWIFRVVNFLDLFKTIF